MGEQAQREDLLVVGARRGVVVGDRLLDASDGEPAGAQGRGRQRRVAGQEIARQRRSAARAAGRPTRRRSRAPSASSRRTDVSRAAAALDRRRRAGAARSRARPAAAAADRACVVRSVIPPAPTATMRKCRRLAEEPRARRGRERRQRLGARVAHALAPVDVGDARRVGHQREPDPRERSRGRSAGCRRVAPPPAGVRRRRPGPCSAR